MGLDLILMDVKSIFADIRLQDIGPFLFWGLWFLALFSSLRGVDRRDEVAQLTYMGCMLGLGGVLILTLPIGVRSGYSEVGKLVVFTVLLILSSLRWMYTKKRSVIDMAVQRATTKNDTKAKS
jgi:hypothetical protein